MSQAMLENIKARREGERVVREQAAIADLVTEVFERLRVAEEAQAASANVVRTPAVDLLGDPIGGLNVFSRGRVFFLCAMTTVPCSGLALQCWWRPNAYPDTAPTTATDLTGVVLTVCVCPVGFVLVLLRLGCLASRPHRPL